MKTMKHAKWLAFGVGAFLIGTVGFVWRDSTRNKDATSKIVRGDVIEAAYAVGTVRANHTFNVKTGVATRVLKRSVQIGDAVKKGDELISLEGFPVYRAPFDGVITALNYEVGELVFAQTAVLTLVNRDSLYLELSLDERTIGSIRQGQEASISFEGFRNLTKKGIVRSVYSSDSTFYVVVDFDPSGMSLYPGMTCDVAVQTGVYKDKLLTPLGAITTANHVTVLKGSPQSVKIKLGANDGKYAVIEDGDVKEGDLVVLRKEAHKGFP